MSAIYNYFRYGEVWRRHSLGLFRTDSAGERFLAVPLLVAVTAAMGLAMLGLLGPLLRLLVGW